MLQLTLHTLTMHGCRLKLEVPHSKHPPGGPARSAAGSAPATGHTASAAAAWHGRCGR